jgi:Flp pilus assembly pilin Flp
MRGAEAGRVGSEDGASAVEYAVIALLVAATVVGAVALIGGALPGLYTPAAEGFEGGRTEVSERAERPSSLAPPQDDAGDQGDTVTPAAPDGVRPGQPTRNGPPPGWRTRSPASDPGAGWVR